MSLFQSNLRKQIGKLPKILKSVKIIQYYSILFNRVLNRERGQLSARGLRGRQLPGQRCGPRPDRSALPQVFHSSGPFCGKLSGAAEKAIKLNSGAILYRAQTEISGNEIR